VRLRLSVAIATATITMLSGSAAWYSIPLSALQADRRTDSSLDAALNRAVAWVTDFEHAFSAVVAEERFEQRELHYGRPDSVSVTTVGFSARPSPRPGGMAPIPRRLRGQRTQGPRSQRTPAEALPGRTRDSAGRGETD
jgi:hypothetical protein